MDRNEQIRQRAHQIWEANGCPEGQEAAHWQQAEEELRAEEGPDGFNLPPDADEEDAPSENRAPDLTDANQETAQDKKPRRNRLAD